MRFFFVVKLILALAVLFYLLKLDSTLPSVEAFCTGLAIAVEQILSLIGLDVMRKGNAVALSSLNAGVIVTTQCSALSYFVTASALGVAFPSPVKAKLTFITVFFIVIQIVNVFRLISLIYAKAWLNSEHFTLLHEQIWPLAFLMISGLMIMHFVDKRALVPPENKSDV